MRAAFLSIFGLISLATVGVVTVNKFTALEATKSTQSYEMVSLRDRERQLKCMADNIYHEAGHESAEGKIAVAQVVMNRVAAPGFPKDPCQVIYQKTVTYEKVFCQFSWYCDSSITRKPLNQKVWNESYDAAKMVLMEGFRLPSLRNALYYHADYVNPQWRQTKVGQIGHHIFYKPQGI